MDRELLERLVEYADVRSSDIILEIGAGIGTLTSLLAEKARTGTVLALELDPALAELLRRRFHQRTNVRVIEGDILCQRHLTYQKVVANPPYSISQPLLSALLRWRFENAVLTLQREFAEKLVAGPGEAQYGQLSVLAGYSKDVEFMEKVPRSAFYPQPKVESVVVRIQQRTPAFHVRSEEVFSSVVKTLFTQRSRVARNGISAFLRKNAGATKVDAKKLLEMFPHLDRRTEDLTGAEFADIADVAVDLVKSTRLAFDRLRFYVFPEVYVPSDDTFLLAKYLDNVEGESVLEVGTGCGILGIIAASRGADVVAVDTNPSALRCALLNAELNGATRRFSVRQSDLFESVRGQKFSCILFNPPYLPTDDTERLSGWLEKAWAGGTTGRETIERFIAGLPNHLEPRGRMLMVLSSLSFPEKVIAILTSLGFEVAILGEEQFDFERLIVLRAVHRN